MSKMTVKGHSILSTMLPTDAAYATHYSLWMFWVSALQPSMTPRSVRGMITTNGNMD